MDIKQLSNAFKIVTASLPVRSSVPIVNGILWDNDKLVTNDLEQSTTVKVEDIGGRIVFPPKIKDIIPALTEEVEIELDGLTANIKSGKAKYKLHCQAGDDFPTGFPGEVKSSVTIPADKLQSAIKSVAFAASQDLSRPSFQGVYFQDGKIIASDTYRLAIADIPITDTALIPAKALKTLQLYGDTEVSFYDTFVKFKSGIVETSIRLLNEKYPDIKAVIPSSYKTKMELQTDELKGILKRAELLTEGKNASITLKVTDELSVNVNSQEGMMEESLPAEIEGEEVSVNINVRYLIEPLSYAPEKVTLEFNGDSGPVVIKWPELYYLTLPIKKVA